jgi:ribosomal protein S12 methylthiotransferase accessory factor
MRLEPVISRLSGLLFQDEYALIDFPAYSACVFCDYNLGIKKAQEMPVGEKPAFIIAKRLNNRIDEADWQMIFSSRDMIILENKNRRLDIKPLRWGLSSQEKYQALKIARQSLGFFLKTGKFMISDDLGNAISPRLELLGSVGVAIWTNGNLRGSKIIQNEKLSRAIIKSAAFAARDHRFKPLAFEELANTRIEITLISDIKVPLVKENLEKQPISPEKGYLLKYFKKTGWYLPEVFNAIKFADLKDLVGQLKDKKAGLEEIDFYDASLQIENFEVFDFIESRDLKNFLDLSGPSPKPDGLENDSLLEKAMLATDWIMNNQEAGGNFTTISHALGNQGRELDWARSAFSGFALSEFGKSARNEKYKLAAEKNLEYLYQYLIAENLKPEGYILALAYLGQAALSLEKNSIAKECYRIISTEAHPRILSPISLEQIGTFFAGISAIHEVLLDSAKKYAMFSYLSYRKENKTNNTQCALYAELINLYVKLFEKTNEKNYFDRAKSIMDWILTYQNKDGSFKVSRTQNNPNTRSAGKIIEILALFANHKNLSGYERNKYKISLKKALDWMFSMQYNKENSFFIKSHVCARILGGIRHTYLDPDAWIDSVGHLLLGISRLIDENGKFDLNYVEPAEIIYPLSEPERLLLESNNNLNKYPLFFGKTFRLEIFFHDSFLKLLGKMGSDSSDIESALGSRNALIRNYDYLLECLAEEKIIEKTDVKSFLTYKHFDNTPGFFEANLKSKQNKSFGRGFGKNWKKCLGQALGELLERHFHFTYDKNGLIRASEKELEGKNIAHLSPTILSVFSDKQKEKYPERKFDENSEFYWEKCVNSANNQIILIPAHLVYCNYKFEKNEPRLREGNTSGLGGWFTPEGAILSGLYEIVQRDAFFYHWLNKIAPERIDPESIDDAGFKKIYLESKKRGFHIICLNLTLPDTKIPSTAVIIEDNSGKGPLYSLGAGCHPDINKALLRSIEEAWSIYYNIRTHCVGKYDKISENYEPFITPLDIQERLSVWGNPEMKEQLDFFIDGKMENFKDLDIDYPGKFKNKKEELDFAVKILKDNDFDVYAHLSKNKILKKTGFYSARVIIPELIPMYYSEQNAPIGHKRIKKKSGVNTLLHLFP